jgi:RNA polymerase sigma factor (sigma-70 family)
MRARAEDPHLDDLLGRAAWARRLARQLVRQGAEADDLLQEAWLVAATKRPPDQSVSRGWLAGVLRVLGMRQARAAGRRRQREAESAIAAPGMAGSPDELLDQVDTQRRLSEALLALAEPYRTTVLLRYYEERSAAEIARRTGVPAGTVRWRLKEGLDRLRAQLDERAGGRRASVLALARFGIPDRMKWGLRGLLLGGGVAVTGAILVGIAVLPPGSPRPETLSGSHLPTNGAPPAPGKEDDMKRTLGALAVVAGLAAHLDAGALAAPQAPPSKLPRFWVPLGVGPVKGPPTAKVTILAFMDYQSPFCAQASQTMDALLAAHPGEIRYQVIHRPLPFHAQAPFASKAAFAAAQQGKFWEMHQALLAHQRALDPKDIEGYAKTIGLDVARFQADLGSPTVINQAELEEANAQSLKITAIPTFFLNGRSVAGAQPRAIFEQVLAEELAYADAVLKAGVRPDDLYNTITRQGATELTPAGVKPIGDDQLDGGQGPGAVAFRAAWKLLNDNAAAATTCYQDGLAIKPTLAGKVVIELRLASGQEPTLLLHASTLNFAKVDNCIVQALKRLAYPKLATGGPIVVRRAFAFSPPGAGTSR